MKEPKVKVVYSGRRWNGKQIIDEFVLPNGKTMLFTKRLGVAIGYTYLAFEDAIFKKPERTDDEPVLNPNWEGLDCVAAEKCRKYRATKKADAKIKALSGKAVADALKALEPLWAGMDLFDREALIRHLSWGSVTRGRRQRR